MPRVVVVRPWDKPPSLRSRLFDALLMVVWIPLSALFSDWTERDWQRLRDSDARRRKR